MYFIRASVSPALCGDYAVQRIAVQPFHYTKLKDKKAIDSAMALSYATKLSFVACSLVAILTT